MKLVLRLALVLALGAISVGAASANTLDKSGTWVPTDTYTVDAIGGVRALINDGSFEQGPPPGSAWSEVSDQACEWIGDWFGVWGVPAADGSYDYWSGGYCNGFPTNSSVTQTILLPGGNPALSFRYISYRADADDLPPDGDKAYVMVNGVEVWSLPFTVANNTYPSWVGPITVDLTAYAGQSVSLKLGGTSVGSLTGNLRFDYVEVIGGGPTAAQNTSWGALKSLYR